MRKEQKGSIVAMTAILMVALIAILGLAIDFGTAYTARTFAQHAADAGALAGADTYAQYSPATTAMATADAQAAAQQNKVLGQPLTASNVTVSFPAAPPGFDRVRVDVNTTVPTFFLRVLGSKWNQVTIGAHAIAEAAPGTVGGTTCLRPLWITQKSLLGGACSNPPPTVGKTLSLWDSKGGILCVSPSACAVSQWGLIDPVSIGYPASDIASWVLSCNSVQINCGTTMGPKTGGTVGDVGKGSPRPVQTLIGQTGSGNDWVWNPDPSTGAYVAGEYTYVPTGQVYSSSPAVVTMAIWDDCTGPAPVDGKAGQTIPVAGFAQIFIDSIDPNGSKKSITAQFISMTNSCTGSGATGSNVASGPGAIPVRLIHTDADPAN
ncbi:MAG TPA: Tad domain-containing protein [Terriglobales bacterium]|nr:Tad domain-containing protein [Terriglobales bacterium]